MTKRARNRSRQRQANQRPSPWRLSSALAVAVMCQGLLAFVFQAALASHHARRALQAVESRDSARAADEAKRALELDPTLGYASYFAGQARRLLSHAKEARDSQRHALRTVAHRGRVLRELAACEKELGETAFEEAHLAEALAIAPLLTGHAAARARLGQLLYARGNWAEGTARFRSIPGERGEARFAFDGLAAGYEQLGAPDIAVAAASALLGSQKLLPRARAHFLRLAQSSQLRPMIVDILQTVAKDRPVGDPTRLVVEQMLSEIASNPNPVHLGTTKRQRHEEVCGFVCRVPWWLCGES